MQSVPGGQRGSHLKYCVKTRGQVLKPASMQNSRPDPVTLFFVPGDNMSRKSMIMLGMMVGSFAGGYLPSLLGADSFLMTALFTSAAGGILGIWIALSLTR